MTQWCAFGSFIALTVPASFAASQLDFPVKEQPPRIQGCLTEASMNKEAVARALSGQVILTALSPIDCHDCVREATVDTQEFCQALLPFKCWTGLGQKWEYKRTRTRWWYSCDGITTVRCGPWSPIEGSECCSHPGGETEPQCGKVDATPRPVILPECYLANP